MRENKLFPWWGGYFLSCSLRKVYQNPYRILAEYIKPSMQVADIGSGMGYFSIPMAHMVGDKGKVVAVDLQQKMLQGLERKAKKVGNISQLETQICSKNSLRLEKWNQRFEFALAFAIAHEVPDRERFFAEIADSMKKGAKLLVAEPIGHVSEECFEESVRIAKARGLKVIGKPTIKLSRSVLLEK